MKAAIYNPYLDTLGGGERYTTGFVKVLLNVGYDVDLEWRDKKILQKIEDRFGFKLPDVRIIKDIKRGDGYDLCFWVSDGSIPTLFSRKNILHFQFPFTHIKGKSLLNKMKLFRINHIVCNSYFTKRFIDAEYGVNSQVIYPPVDVVKIKPKRKENIILSVGRFSQLTQVKHQDVLIKVFKKMVDGKGLAGWKLILAGGSEVGARKYLKRLKKLSKSYPIEIIESPNFREILSLYGKAKLFWSAVGYGVDEDKDPKKVEHFGISVVEAMAAGAIPLAYNAGGHKETIADGKSGYLWSKKSQLAQKTIKIISDLKLLKRLAENSRDASRVYEFDRFESEVSSLL
jgi:glycosyltransferase involved in cell wall biosynthesis